jgi:hypothetical protein
MPLLKTALGMTGGARNSSERCTKNFKVPFLVAVEDSDSVDSTGRSLTMASSNTPKTMLAWQKHIPSKEPVSSLN